MGRLVIGIGVVFCAGALGYLLHGGQPFGTAVITILPLFGIFVAMGWSMCRLGADGPGVMAAYLAAVVGACGLVASCVTGR
jgi:hypothetical protein